MSSILKALKKLEDKNSRRGDYSWAQDAGVRETINQQAKISWLMNKIIFGLVLVIILAGTGWLVLNQKSQKPVSETASADKKVAAAQTTTILKTEIKDLKSVAASENKASEEADEEVQVKSEKEETEPVPVPEKSVVKTEPPKIIPRPEKKVSEQPIIAQKEPARIEKKKVPSPAKDLSPADEKELANLKNLEDQLPKLREIATPEQAKKLNLLEEQIDVRREKIKSGDLDRKSFPPSASAGDSKLKIQAIVWSNNPKDRLAMINDNIVRVGGIVEGLTVTYIGEDYITVKEGEEERTLKFQLK
jgi:outer membrane biosynthesis protein TonB